MSTYRRPGKREYSYDFRLGGRRFSGSTGQTTKREAEAHVRDLKDRLRAAAAEAGPRDSLNMAAGRWWRETGAHRRDAKDAAARLERLVRRLGPETPVAAITQDLVAGYVAARRGETGRHGRPLAPATVNRETEILRAVLRRAALAGDRVAPIAWRAVRLREPPPRERILTEAEEAAVFAALRPDFRAFFAAMLETGWRFGTAAGLEWRDVGEDAVVRAGKGGRIVRTPITPYLRILIEGERGNHPRYVFTFIAESGGGGRSIGGRYPIGHRNADRVLKEACAAAGVAPFNIHQLRHTAATRLLRSSGNPRLVQELLAHSRIETSMRYVHNLQDDLARAMVEARGGRGDRPRLAGKG